MRFFLLLAFLLLTFSPPGIAGDRTDLVAWGTLPILHEGRVKPLDSFARTYLKTFSGRDNINGESALQWLAQSVFTPEKAINIAVFKIRTPARYNLKKSPDKLYSYVDLSTVIQNRKDIIQKLIKTPEENWSKDQYDLMTLHENFILYTQILRSLTSFIGLNENQKDLEKQTKKIIRRKGNDPEKYTDAEKEIVFLSYQLNLLSEGGKNNVLFRIIPLSSDNKDTQWLSPWAFSSINDKPEKSIAYLQQWQKLSQNYGTADFTNHIKNIDFPVSKTKLVTEKIYNLLYLTKTALILYSLGFLFVVLSHFKNKKYLQNLAALSLGMGVFAQIIHIIFRIYILERPPVGTLYESIIFVSLICVLGFFYLSRKQKNMTGITLGSLSGIILLTTAQGFTGHDTMGTLVAVLNTNFWLATHVLCITIGYGCCFIAALMAHYALITRHFKNKDWQNMVPPIKTMLILSLLFTTIGTILGGIWADQSWGRFWGWDPKENGALLIILWLAWLLHGRISDHINEIGLMIGTALLSIIVVLAWFGVNLLNIGLHSYGFINGVAWGIGLFCAFELLFVGGFWLASKKQTAIR